MFKHLIVPLVIFSTVACGDTQDEDRLINGEPANPKDWPSSVYSRSGNSACSATVVGPRTLIEAAHCMGNGSSVRFSVGGNEYTAKCTHHPEYRGRNSTADWALCVIDKEVVGGPYEVIETEPAPFKIGDRARLTGYGCIKPGGGGGNDGVFRIGYGQVTDLPSGKNYDTVTKGGAALCFGDSGGAMYRETADGKRYVSGINSRGDIKTMSYLSSTYVDSFQAWAKSWASTNKQEICGLHANVKNCRNVKPPTPPEPPEPPTPPGPNKFVVDSKVAKATVEIKAGFENLYEWLKVEITNVLESHNAKR